MQGSVGRGRQVGGTWRQWQRMPAGSDHPLFWPGLSRRAVIDLRRLMMARLLVEGEEIFLNLTLSQAVFAACNGLAEDRIGPSAYIDRGNC